MYKIFKEIMKNEEIEYETYGIECGDEIISDISTDKDFVEKIVRKLNDGQVSLLHIKDIVEDEMLR